MKLNPDCIRDVLIVIEVNTSLTEKIFFSTLNTYNLNYSYDEISYHIKQCELNQFIDNVHWLPNTFCEINYLTPKGHEFLANIRSNTVWNKTISIANKLGSISLDVLVKVSTGVLTQMINKHLGY